MAALAAEQTTELPCVIIPLAETQLLVPAVCIAEILPWRRVKAIADTPPWCLGLLGWRGEMVPVLRFEVMNGQPDPASGSGRCMVVMNRARNARGLAFYAFATEGLPRLVQLTAEDLCSEPSEHGSVVSTVLKVGTETALLPNLEVVEQAVAKLVG